MTTEAARRRRLLIFGGALLVVIAAVAVIIAVSSGGGSKSNSASSTSSAGGGGKSPNGLKGFSAVEAEFGGIPQSKNTLGNANAPATMMVFADLQCPFCADFENQALPALIKRYVKTGKLKVVFQPIAILGNDSVLGARASAAAALQNKMFDFNAILYRNQGQENSGYMTADFLKKVATGTPGMNPNKFATDLSSPSAEAIASQAQSIATSAHVSSTPSFFIAKRGKTLQQLQVTSLGPSAFYGELDKLTR